MTPEAQAIGLDPTFFTSPKSGARKAQAQRCARSGYKYLKDWSATVNETIEFAGSVRALYLIVDSILGIASPTKGGGAMTEEKCRDINVDDPSKNLCAAKALLHPPLATIT